MYFLSIDALLFEGILGKDPLFRASAVVAILLIGAVLAILRQRGTSWRTKLITVSIVLALIAFIVLSLRVIIRYYQKM